MSGERLAVVTGSGRGIGRAVALALAQPGTHLVLAARTASELEETASACRAEGAAASLFPTDISDEEQVRILITAAAEIMGRIDVLVNCAGVYGPIGATSEVECNAWVRGVEVNLFGPLFLCRYTAPHMTARRSGKIILLAGGGAASPLPFFSSYAASKAALVRFAETLAEELKEFNVQVNAVAPGLVDTRLQDEVLAAGERAGPLLDKILTARQTGAGAVPPEVAARLVAFLASAASGALTGKLISAPHDRWEEWPGREADLNSSALYTLRRLDPFTLQPLLEEQTYMGLHG